MKGKIFGIVFLVLVLTILSANVTADQSENNQGVIRFEQDIGHIVMWSQGYGCSIRIDPANYDNNDFKMLNSEGIWFWKIQEDATLEYYDYLNATWYYGLGHVSYNWHYGDNISYGNLHARGYVDVDSEIKNLECKLVIDETGELEINRITLK